ncbi:hypothetical protein HS041_12185 [Planomonospora sp. ID67723]|uniref:hypothetical protein n=1 Tax=Planomonospora sp. ID67723 TaxID=2738134 RepID=UPI0018C40527|nr:hypothetical protein [Planomonospora sp. ID67723]MBG0828527.1 hypothetical protein [Planomonospora sp. ID67723]
MADYSRREVTQTWVEYTLPNPTNWGQINRLISVIQYELGDRADWDDAVQVVGRDEEIVFRWEKETRDD